MSHKTLWAEWKATDSVDFVDWLEAKYAALEAEVASLRINQHTEPEICHTCLGTGLICTALPNGSVCPVCSGSGKLRASR